MRMSTNRLRDAFVVGAFLAAATASGQQTARALGVARLLILSKNERMLSIVDPATLKIVGRVPAGPDPHEVVASADGTRAYISNYGGGQYNTLTVVDLVNQKSLGTIDLGALRGPHGLDFAGGKVWFTSEVAKVVGSYDPATNKVDLVIGTGQNGTHMVYAYQDLSRLVTTNVGSGTVSIISKRAGPRPDWDVITVQAGGRVEGMDVSPDGKQIWAANAQQGTITVIDVASISTTALDAGVTGANRLKFTPDGKLVLVSTPVQTSRSSIRRTTPSSRSEFRSAAVLREFRSSPTACARTSRAHRTTMSQWWISSRTRLWAESRLVRTRTASPGQ